ncbi:MAG: hypothetical protein AVDCRST_MAG67-471, partial [uncultured Solirubrobacteraceae bacterium]
GPLSSRRAADRLYPVRTGEIADFLDECWKPARRGGAL